MAGKATFKWLTAALLLGFAPAAQASPGMWSWAAHQYGITAAEAQTSTPGQTASAELLLPYWDAWLLRPPGTDAAGLKDPIDQPLPGPKPLPVLSAKAWIYISKAQQRLFLKDGETTVISWPVSTARYSLSTPVGRFKIIEEVPDPPYSGRHGYYKPHDPKNPLGTRWIGLNVGHFRTGVPIGIHGTNEPDKIGSAVSDGCIRLRNADVETLFKLVKNGTPVVISNQ